MTDKDFTAFCAFVHRAFGIALTPAKKPLVRMRLRSVVAAHGLHSMREYLDQVLARPDTEALSELANAITTNHTFFWRESAHFELLRGRIMDENKRRGERAPRPSLRLWCAAASTGQEPYTLAAAVRLALGADAKRWDVGILGTDLSARALEQAKVGVYTEAEVEPLPAEWRRTMFEPAHGELRVKDDLRADVTLRRMNLLAPFRFRQAFDAIYCRNVMIYFDEDTRADLTRRMVEVLRPGGYLVVGLSESLGAAPPNLRHIAPAVYQRGDAP